MAALAIAGRQGLGLLDLEMLSPQPSYTSTTLDRLQALGFDPRGVYLVTGADAFRDIETWKDYPALLDRCHFAVVSRPDRPASSLKTTLPTLASRMILPAAGLPPDGPAIVLVDAPTAPVSSTDIRRRLASGESIAGMVPDLVARYIERQGLYT